MLKTVEGLYKDGKVELLEPLQDIKEARVLVTFMPQKRIIDLRERGISEQEAAELRWRFQAFAEDWEHPDMDVYDEL